MPKEKIKHPYHMVKIPNAIWRAAWSVAITRPDPTSPAEIIREILRKKLKV